MSTKHSPWDATECTTIQEILKLIHTIGSYTPLVNAPAFHLNATVGSVSRQEWERLQSTLLHKAKL